MPQRKVKCPNCGNLNLFSEEKRTGMGVCGSCHTHFDLSKVSDEGDTSAAVGLIGGALLGAAIGGPPGAIIGGILGALLGKSEKGVG